MWRDEREALDKDINKCLQADKKQWHRNQVQHNMTSKETWQGIRLIKEEFKPEMYARRDMNGNVTILDERAEATATYLDNCQWSNTTSTDIPQDASEETKHLVHRHLTRRQQEHTGHALDDDEIKPEELKRTITNMKRNKAPGTDTITTGGLKDRDEQNLSNLLELLNTR